MSFRKMRPARQAGLITVISLLTLFSSNRVAGDGMFRLAGHVQSRQIHNASYLGHSDSREPMSLAVVLKPRNQAALDDFLRRVHDPRDPEFRKFLTPAEFAERFGPSESDVREVSEHLGRYGLRVRDVHTSRLVLEVEGTTAGVEDAFQVQVNSYRSASGRLARAANADPIFPAAVAGKVHLVAGLSEFSERRPRTQVPGGLSANALPRASIGDYMTPAKIKSAYSMDTLTQTGAGETLAIFTLAGYTASDVNTYASTFGLPAPNLENVLVDGVDGSPGSGAEETTLDIELAMAVAPGLSKILVYQGPNTDAGVLHTYSKIANDNRASVVSVSWGLSEDLDTAAFLNGENAIFQQMVAQGQAVFVASGDYGAFDNDQNRNVLSVDDPASQPYVTAVGGTTLALTTANTYKAESSWGGTKPGDTGGGGGVSKVWALPSWQASVATNNNGESATNRMVPDVSLNSNPLTGYPIYYAGGWYRMGGTSCAAPIWAAFATLVNQKLVADGKSRLGFANPALYQIARSAQYPAAFHDVDDDSRNIYYFTAPNYDLSTGWGSLNGLSLLNNLTAASLPAPLAVPGAPSGLTAQVTQ